MKVKEYRHVSQEGREIKSSPPFGDKEELWVTRQIPYVGWILPAFGENKKIDIGTGRDIDGVDPGIVTLIQIVYVTFPEC